MTIANFCSKDTVTIQTITATTGDSFGVAEAYSTGTAMDCLVQTLTAAEAMEYEAKGTKASHILFFSSDPSIDATKRIRWGSKYLRYAGHYKEGRPGEWLLWIVLAEEITTRRES